MQSKETIDRLTNPPIIDGRNKPIDLGDMPEDMDVELAKAAIYDIVEEICAKYQYGDLKSKTCRYNLGVAIFRKIKDEGFLYRVIDKEKEIKDTMQEDEKLVFEEDFGDGEPTTADEYNKVYISDINKEISEEWINLEDRTRQERIALEKDYEERKKITKEDKIKYLPKEEDK
jgi:hypothetical protein